ncbi:MAG: cell wall hydrolase [Lachnospiraceae bacterium]|nr:cell wall hydrolase [Lachnospiraceae bacterium]
MYKRCAGILLLLHMIILVNIANLDLQNRLFADAESSNSLQFARALDEVCGNERYVQCNVLSKEMQIEITDEELDVLARIVEAEAGGEDLEGKILVANVVINRVLDDAFPDTVTEVVFQEENGRYQFSPVGDGRYYNVRVSEDSYLAAYYALLGQDNSEGALYFVARAHAQEDRLRWFDENLTPLFAHGGHEFFR